MRPIYGHGMYATPSIDGWQYGMREVNGYSAEITIYGDGLARAWNDYAITITDYVNAQQWVIDGKAQGPAIRAQGLRAMRDGRRDGLHVHGYRRIA